MMTVVGDHGARLSGWGTHAEAGVTYALVEDVTDDGVRAFRRRFSAVRIDEPPLIVLDVEVCDPNAIPRLRQALAGRAAPVGVVSALRTISGVLIELDDARTPLAFLMDLIDAEVGPGPAARRICPLLELPDRALVRLAAATLHVPELDETRLIETYSEPLLKRARA
ncbi:MAG: hypothetical protein JO060_10850 [Candidatus Eremiobacteraeota bacterium]|nr:hypothetical protein [Candidatus Eremiobacteraeota bacterium]